MDHGFRFTAEKIRTRIALVEAHRFRAARPMAPFRFRAVSGATEPPSLTGDTSDWQEIRAGDYWGGADCHFTLRTRFELPEGWAHPALYLPLGTLGDIFNHPEALLYLDGEIVGSADRHHDLIALEMAAGAHELALHGWSGLAGWPPAADAADRLLMRQAQVVDLNPGLEEFLILAACALEAADLLEGGAEKDALLDALDRAFLVLDTRHPMAALHATAEAALAALQSGLTGPPMAARLTGLGHAHMDIAYLWPVAESRQKNARTYSNVLRLMARHPEYHFTHSQPQLYEYTAEDYPGIFDQIRARIAEGRWEVTGGMWVEPDTNLPGAEALVRQILLGRRWFREAFGDVETPILWLPDTFGFSWCLPQLMALSGLEMVVTNKLNWNQHNRPPASTTWWEGMDGTRVLFHILTTPRAVQHLPFPTNYKSDLSGVEVKGTWTNAQNPIDGIPICFGFGDGGGGPTEALIARAKAFAAMPSMPQLRMGRASDVLAAVKAAPDLHVWQDEFNMEGHRGVLTSQAWIKRANRQAEAALHRAELLGVLTGRPSDLSPAWKKLCLNQFHDTLSGTAIGKVFDEARADYALIRNACLQAERAAIGSLVGAIAALNPSPLPRHGLALLDHAPEGVTAQQVAEGHLIDLPPLEAYQAAPLAAHPTQPLEIQADNGFRLENALVRAEIGPDGTLTRLLDKSTGRDALRDRGNQLWAFEDRPVSWDAWDIDPFFEDRAEEITDLTSATITETGPLRVALRIERRFRQSRITQHIRLTDRSPTLEYATEIDWHERHTLLKAAFPLAVQTDQATYDIQWGQIARPTTRDTRRDASRFEVCGHKWAALHDGAFAVAVINDGKYGHDAHKDVLRLTLVKSSTMPDPEADQGRHTFTYGILATSGPGFETIRAEAEALNHPPLIAPGLATLPHLVRVSPSSVIPQTIKPAEDGPGYILRLYEAEGRPARLRLTFGHKVQAMTEVNLLEDPIRPRDPGTEIPLRPFQILSLHILPG